MATLKNIRFSYQATSGSGIVGPVRLNQVNMTAGGSVPVPSIHEHGALVSIHEIRQRVSLRGWSAMGKGNRPKEYKVEYPYVYYWRRRDLRRRAEAGDVRRVRRARYPKRPFMSVALQQEVDSGKIMAPWKDSIREP